MRELLRRAGRQYMDWLNRYPVRTKALTSFGLMVSADIVAQTRSDEPYDVIRSARFGSFSLIFAFAGHYWYGFAERYFSPQRSVAGLLKSVSVDQLVFSPIVSGVLFTYIGVLEGKTVPQIKLKLNSDLPTTVVNSWIVWAPTQLINFRYVPESFRLPVVSSVAFLWNIYLAVMTSKPVETTKEDEMALSAAP